MWRGSALLIFLIPSAFVGFVSCVGFYTIVAPKNIRPNLDYQVSLTLHNEIKPTTIRLSILDGGAYKNEKEVTVDSNKTELVTLRINDLDVTKGYKLVAEGLSGIIFKNESSLKVESKNVSIFIQTDKAIYKPGETVKFRVLVLDSKLKPVTLKSDTLLNIYLSDPEKNRIKQWLNVNTVKGVFSSEMQLSELPLLGQWSILAEIGGEKKTKVVEVAEYVLPKFDVTIDSPTDFSAKDGKIRAIVRSKYTYGKLVKGEAIVSLTPSKSGNYYPYSESVSKDSVLKTVPIDGKGTVEFDVENDLKLDFTEYTRIRYFELGATVIEELTGRNQSASKDITIHQTRYKFNPIDLNHEFSAGIPISFSLGITHQDGSPVLLNDETRTVTIGKISDRYTSTESVKYFKFDLNQNGTAQIRIPTSVKEINFYLEVKYMDEEYDLGFFYPLSISEPSELEVKVLTKKPAINQNIFVEVQSIHLLQNFTYQLIAHGKVILAENVAVPDRKYHVFKFKATFELVPKAILIVYRFKGDDIIATKTEIAIDEDLDNFVKIKLSSLQSEPGKDINIDVITNPQSFVGLLGVDQSVLLLKKNDGLTKEDAMREMSTYQEYFHNTEEGPWQVEPRHYANNYWRNFERSGVILFTNAKQDSYKVRRYRPHAYAVSNRSGMAWAVSTSSAGNSDRMLFESRSESETDSSLTELNPVEPPRIRQEFPETWLWDTIDDDSFNGTKTLTKKVPDTITSWVITAFSIDPKTGLGLTKIPKTLKVFQPFFISLNLPYSVKRGEVVAVPVVLFNYLDSDVVAELTVHNENGEFEFVDASNNAEGQAMRKRQVRITSNNGISASFLVRFNAVGPILVKVTATSAIAGDAIVRLLQVDPEGVAQFVNKAVFVDLREAKELDVVQSVDIPENAVPGSVRINVNAVGDLLGGTIKNLHELIRLPTGCGEQNMLKFVPNVVVLDYLKAAGESQPAIVSKAVKYLTSGYQRELTYRHKDGSFSSFGKWDRKGSTWLTAFVAKSFKQAETYIDIDDTIIRSALDWLSSIQAADGSFPEVGQISHDAMQGGSSKGLALTAYTTIAFIANKRDGWKHQETVDKAISNIVANLKDADSLYATAVATYALQLAGHPTKDEALDTLVSKSITKDQQKLWSRANGNPNARQSKSINVEITSYGVLALIEAKRMAESLPYFKWLLAQRNDQGGFVGTQDTVIGLEALAKFAGHLSTKNKNVQLKIQSEANNDTFISVKSENALLLQTVDLPPNTKSVHLLASGHGFALCQLSYRYNLNNSDAYSSFTLKPKLKESTAGHITVEVCASFNPKSDSEKHSNMVVLEVSMPSGFITEKDTLQSLLKTPSVKLVETKKGETMVDVYIDQMLPNVEMCVEVQGYRSHKVAENKPVPVRIYDYYDSSRSAQEFYEIPFISSCEICEGEECSKLCKK